MPVFSRPFLHTSNSARPHFPFPEAKTAVSTYSASARPTAYIFRDVDSAIGTDLFPL